MKSCIIQRYEIQPRTLVYINAWGIARDPEYWENPMEFWPERFLNSAVDIKGQDFGLIPFGSGRRNCPGMSLGLVTVELALANLLYSFDWELPRRMKAEDIDSDVLPGITVHKKNALCLVPRNYLEGYEIQPRTLVYINAWGIARDPGYWENPMEFWPERFLNSAVDIKGQDFGLIPIGSGRRNSPGMSLGLGTVELALANLLYSFDWELPRGMKAEDIDSDVLPGITVHKKNALCLVPRNYLCT
ncbi:cytochrome P450 71B37-like [Olea europaea var. sylvestris]|uniref:cytochrome P450 71B37-like n=1 Tax=Olea europaea var. sylvestris TaxID=158386 RepID=UPI000C1CD810|nr:cytochrome P450 71B37-like [Olea europaea var. sylvestris]